MPTKAPYNKREDKNMNKAYAKTEKGVKPVAKDTNKTRRKNTLEPLPNKTKANMSFKKLASAEKSKKGSFGRG